MRELDDRAIYILKDLDKEQFFSVLNKCAQGITRERSDNYFNEGMKILHFLSFRGAWAISSHHGSANMYGINALELFETEN